MKHKEIVFILISTFTLVVAWIVFNIYHSSATSTISESISVQIAPITPSFDDDTIENLKSRKKIEPVLEIQKNQEEEKSASSSPVGKVIELPIFKETNKISSQSASQSALRQGIP